MKCPNPKCKDGWIDDPSGEPIQTCYGLEPASYPCDDCEQSDYPWPASIPKITISLENLFARVD